MDEQAYVRVSKGVRSGDDVIAERGDVLIEIRELRTRQQVDARPLCRIGRRLQDSAGVNADAA